MNEYLPEGMGADAVRSFDKATLRRAYEQHLYLEARPLMCDSGHNLHFDLGTVHAVMPRTECALGIADGSVRDIAIISRVNKLTGFYITELNEDSAVLSRVERQNEVSENYISKLVCGDIIDARITRIESFGAFCDIGAGIIALLPVDSVSVSRIPSPAVRFRTGDCIKAAVRSFDTQGRVLLTHKELLGTWEENAALFNVGETVTGVIRSTESYGVFVELMPNLAGLAEFNPEAQEGRRASVFIKSINPEKMKIKLIIVDTDSENAPREPVRYFTDSGHIDYWQYSPDCCERRVFSRF